MPQFTTIEEMQQSMKPKAARHNVEFPQSANLFANMRRDLGYGIRQIKRSPGFAVMGVLTIALGVGANTAIFSLIEGALLRPLPYQNPDRLVVVWQTDALHRDSGAYVNAYREFEAWRENSRSFEKHAAL